jgi:hypothetical protein
MQKLSASVAIDGVWNATAYRERDRQAFAHPGEQLSFSKAEAHQRGIICVDRRHNILCGWRITTFICGRLILARLDELLRGALKIAFALLPAEVICFPLIVCLKRRLLADLHIADQVVNLLFGGLRSLRRGGAGLGARRRMRFRSFAALLRFEVSRI